MIMNLNTVNTILKHFRDKPSTADNSFERLRKQFGATYFEVAEAKKLFKENKEPSEIKEDRILKKEVNYDFEKGTQKATIESTEEINTPEQLFEVLGLNPNEWVCTQFWSIIKNGKWNISALIKAVNLPTESIDLFKDFQPRPYENIDQEHTDQALVVYLSDRHIGAETKKNSIIPNEYNAKIYAERMEKVYREIKILNDRHLFSDIVIVDLGDLIDGQDGFTTRRDHRLPQNMNNREVFETFLNVELNFFHNLKSLNANIHRYSIGDSNHGGDFEWYCNKSLEYILSSDPDISINTGSKFIEHFYIGDHCFIICHGKDSEDMKSPMPKNLDAKTELYIKSYMDSFNIKTDPKYVHFIKGDLHQIATEYGKFFRYKNCPSMYGSSKWASTNFMYSVCAVSFDILGNDSITEHHLFF